MKIEQALIGSKIGVFSDTRSNAADSTGAQFSGVETEGVPGVVVTVSDDLATDAGRLRQPQPTAEGIFGSLFTPQTYAVTRPLSVSQATGAGDTLRTSSLVATTAVTERAERGLGALGNTPDPVQGRDLFERTGTDSREVRVLRGETVADAITNGVQLSRSFVENPAQNLANDQQGTPFALQQGLPDQYGPKPVSADGFGPVVSSLNANDELGAASQGDQLGGQLLAPSDSSAEAGFGLMPPGPQGAPSPGEMQFQLEDRSEANAGLSEVRISSADESAVQRAADMSQRDDSPGPVEQDGQRGNDSLELSKAEEKVVQELRARDREVREHEQAHVSSSGGLAGTPTYTYTTGPDNVQYAVGGEVSIDMSEGGSPEETIEKARTVQRAALAPAEPSAQDRAVAAAASRMELDAQVQLRDQRIEETEQVTQEAAVNTQTQGLALSGAQGVFQPGQSDSQNVQATPTTFEPVPNSLPTEEATVREINETVRPSLNSEAFQELRTFREKEEDVVEVRAGSSQRGVADYQRSENAYQAQDDYISVA